jgi:hypothetical protein
MRAFEFSRPGLAVSDFKQGPRSVLAQFDHLGDASDGRRCIQGWANSSWLAS